MPFKKCIASIIVGLAMVITMTSGVLAQQETPTAQETIVATVDFTSARITKQSGNEFTIAFGLGNKIGVQSQIRYSVFLTRVSEGEPAVLDKQVYDEVLTLKEGESVEKEVIYKAPSFLQGQYLVTIEAFTSAGLPLAATSLGAVALEGTGEYVEIIPSSCYFKIGDEKDDFSAFQGVDIARKESLRLQCRVKNRFSGEVQVYPAIATYADAEVGELVSRANRAPIRIAAEKEQEIEIEMPLSSDPGAYIGVMVLEDENKIPASNALATYYVIQGANASAQNVVFDKSSYKKGEVASVTLTWFGSAGPFAGARLEDERLGEVRIITTLADKKGRQCAEPYVTNQEEGWRVVKMQIEIAKECEKVNATVITQSMTGELIDETMFATEKVVSDAASGRRNNIVWILGVIGIMLLVSGGYWFIKRRGGGAKIGIVATLCVLGVGVMGGSVEAMTQLNGVGPNGYIQTSQSAQELANAMGESARTAGSAYSQNIINTQLTGCSYLSYSYAASACRPQETQTQQPPRPPVQQPTQQQQHSSGISIVYTPPAPATCGSANGQQYTSQPYAGLCSRGTATQMSGSNPWTWRCGSEYCSTVTGTAGRCGLASYGRVYGERPTEDLCSIGSPSVVTLQSAGTYANGQTVYRWGWVCYGLNGGMLASCSAEKGPTPRVDGGCGTVNGQTLENAPTTGLCARGTASSITGTGPWYWSCLGTGGGWPASCIAFKREAPVNGACGFANGLVYSYDPLLNVSGSILPSNTYCYAGERSVVTGSNPWNWTCAGSNGGSTASCSASQVNPAVNGTCGAAHGQTRATAPVASLCGTGPASAVTGSGPWSWTCAGSNGGSTASCSAAKTTPAISGSCGVAHGRARTTAPTTGLCNSGTASAVTGSGPWNWTCAGSNGGGTASCNAPKGMRIIEI